MKDEFYRQLTQCVEKTARKTRTVELDPAVWSEFCASAAPVPAVEKPPVRQSHPVAARPVAPPSATPSPVPPPVVAAGLDWEELRSRALSCQNCRLCETRKHVVFGEGNPRAELMFIGEGPGADEDATGRPFVGKAGQLLDKMIAAMKFRREDVYIANVVKCRPPGNRAPELDEAAACIGYLKRQIELVQPKVIVLLGGTAVSFVLKTQGGITRLRGNWQSLDGIPVMPTFHPAFLLRQESAKRDAWKDLQMVMKALGK